MFSNATAGVTESLLENELSKVQHSTRTKSQNRKKFLPVLVLSALGLFIFMIFFHERPLRLSKRSAHENSDLSNQVVLIGDVTFVSDVSSKWFGSVCELGKVVDNSQIKEKESNLNIWTFSFQGYDTVTSSTAEIKSRNVQYNGRLWQFTWKQVRIHSSDNGKSEQFVDVKVFARVDSENGLTLVELGFSGASKPLRPTSWSIGIATESSTTTYQILQNLGFGALHSCNSSSSSECGAFSNVYPHETASFQLLSLMNDHGAAYFAAHDHDYATKTIISTGRSFQVKQAVALDPGKLYISSYTTPYPLALGVIEGEANWFEVAQLYRSAFALSTLERHGRKRMSKRTDLPNWFEDVTVWVNSHWQPKDIFNPAGGSPSVVSELMKTVIHKLDLSGIETGDASRARLGFHWYEWDTLGYEPGSNYSKCLRDDGICGFDTNYPAYFPVREGFDRVSQSLQNQGVAVMPYINGRIMDRDTALWNASAQAAAAKKNDALELYTESYGSRARFAVMCPATSYWQKTLSNTLDRLSKENNIEYVYVDQVAAASPEPCLDPNHNHSISGGSYWTTGQFAWLQRAKALALRRKKKLVVMTEGLAEPYVGLIDAFLTIYTMTVVHTVGSTVLVPFFQSVYGGYATWVGSEFSRQDLLGPDGPDVFAVKIAKQLVFGVQLGWFALLQRHFDHAADFGLFPLLFASDQYADELQYLRLLARARFYLKPFFVHGFASYPPMISSNKQKNILLWDNIASQGKGTESTFQSATWLSADRIRLLVLYTWAERHKTGMKNATEVIWTIPDVQRYGLVKSPSNKYNINRLDLSTGKSTPVGKNIPGPRLSFSSMLGRRKVDAFVIVSKWIHS